jgi:hypothetical protein
MKPGSQKNQFKFGRNNSDSDVLLPQATNAGRAFLTQHRPIKRIALLRRISVALRPIILRVLVHKARLRTNFAHSRRAP